MQNLKELRKAKGLTQAEVASKLGVSQQAYAKYESGQVTLSAEVYSKLASIFGDFEEDDFVSKGVGKDATIEEFLNSSYTAYHAVLNAVSMLKGFGFEEVTSEDQTFEIGGKYFITKNSSAVIAFRIGDLSHYAFNIAGSHTDSPCFRVKGNMLLDSPEGKRFNVEKYGGMLMYSFLDTPLKLAGRVFEQTNNGFTQKVVESKRLFNIPSLCVHHNPTANNEFSPSVQNDMCPLVGEGEDVYSFVSTGKVVDGDLFVVPAVKAYESGNLLCSPRIYNLTSVYSSLKALANCDPKGVAVAACFDN
ncbi:MAG: helix-turn-helix domain-containing protein, partial [Clostridia bacterium]|nr:helix-turn-helix domain-containing protein [Clostridia bacterium]